MAEGLLRHLSFGDMEVQSAGTVPGAAVHPLAIETMRRRFGIDISKQRPKSVDVFAGQHFDVVITVCDAAAEACPVFPAGTERLHWGFADPAAVTGEAAARHAFEAVAVEIATRLRLWLTILGRQTADLETAADPSPDSA
jgi:protein-tyrosine-phosphatase